MYTLCVLVNTKKHDLLPRTLAAFGGARYDFVSLRWLHTIAVRALGSAAEKWDMPGSSTGALLPCDMLQDPVFISRLFAYNVNKLMEVISEAWSSVESRGRALWNFNSVSNVVTGHFIDLYTHQDSIIDEAMFRSWEIHIDASPAMIKAGGSSMHLSWWSCHMGGKVGAVVQLCERVCLAILRGGQE